MTKIKSKYKLGQALYYIANGGYVTCGIVRGILYRSESIEYSFVEPTWKYENDEGYLKIKSEDRQFEESVFPTRDALIKSIKELELEPE